MIKDNTFKSAPSEFCIVYNNKKQVSKILPTGDSLQACSKREKDSELVYQCFINHFYSRV